MSAALVPGDAFNPHKMFFGSIVPNWLLCRKELGQGAKICYGRMTQYSGKGGICKPQQKTLANEIGVSARQVRDYIRELEIHRLLKTVQPGLGMANRYTFVWHEWMQEDVDVEVPNDNPRPEQKFRSERKQSSPQSGTNVPLSHIDEKNQVQESSTGAKAPELPNSQFARLWCEEFPKYHDGNSYKFQGAKDGTAIKRLLASGYSVDRLITGAIMAWKHHFSAKTQNDSFECKFAATIAGYDSRFNQIVEELRVSKKKHNPEGSNMQERLSSPIL